jgi:hypothetical protein
MKFKDEIRMTSEEWFVGNSAFIILHVVALVPSSLILKKEKHGIRKSH